MLGEIAMSEEYYEYKIDKKDRGYVVNATWRELKTEEEIAEKESYQSRYETHTREFAFSCIKEVAEFLIHKEDGMTIDEIMNNNIGEGLIG